MSKQSKAKLLILDEALYVASTVNSESESDDESGPITLLEPKKTPKRKQPSTPRIPKKARVENGVKYDILEEAPAAGSSSESLTNRCKKGRFHFY